MQVVSIDHYRRDIRRDAECGCPVPLDARLAIQISESDADSYLDWIEDQTEHLPLPELVGYDVRRVFGDDGYDFYARLVALSGKIWTVEEREQLVSDDWQSFDRERLPSDIPLIDAMDDASGFGWQPSEALAADFERLRDMSDKTLRQERDAEEREWQAAADREHAEWVASGEPDLLAELMQKRKAALLGSTMQNNMPQQPDKKLVLTDAEFVADFQPPEYILDGIMQRGYCYSLTAQTGAGKTAIALRLAMHVGLGKRLGDRDVTQGTVLYFASENAIDVQARWIAMAEHCGFEIGKTNVQFVSGATRLSEIADRISCEVQANGSEFALIVVDTSAATFEGDDENSNVDAIDHAKRMRSLTALPGVPTVLVLCHPTKRATTDDLIPRGGGAFLAEVDGNLCARKSDSAVEMHWAGKFRGMEFAPIMFELRTVTAIRLRDKRGRSIPTVLAAPLDDAARQAMAAAGRKDENEVLRAIEANPTASSNDLAKALGWAMRDGKPYGVKVRRATDKLAADGLIHKHRDAWALTAKGEKELNALDLRRNDPLTPGTKAQNGGVPIVGNFQAPKPH